MTIRSSRRLLVAGAPFVVAALLAASAVATIVPGQGLAGVRLRMSEAQVRAALGAPLTVTRTRGALGFLVTRLHYARVTVDLQRLGGEPVVVRVLTTSPGERTASGVRVGSPIAAAARLRGAHCSSQPAGQRYCRTGNGTKPLSRFTLFESRSGRISLVEVALLVNS
jgi:hypothetical protein